MNNNLSLLICSLGGLASVLCSEEELADAIKHNKIEVVRSLLGSQHDITVSFDEVRYVNSKEMAQLLIAYNPVQDCMRACCAAAIKYNWPEVIQYLIEKRGLAFSKKRDTRTLAIVAAQYNRCALMKYLVSKDEGIAARPIRGNYTPLHEAAKRGNFAMVQLLVEECKVPINPLFAVKRKRYCVLGNGKGRAPLHAAAENGHGDIVRYLLQKGAEVDVQDGNGDTPRKLARKRKRFAVIHIFDEHDRKLEQLSHDEEQRSSSCPKPRSSRGSESCLSPSSGAKDDAGRAVTIEVDDETLAFLDFFSLRSSSSSHNSPTGSLTTSSVSSETYFDDAQNDSAEHALVEIAGCRSTVQPAMQAGDSGSFLDVGTSSISPRRREHVGAPELLTYKRQKNLQEAQTVMPIDEEVRKAVICGNFTQLAVLLNHFPQMIMSKSSAGVGLLQLAAAHGHDMIFLFLVSIGMSVTVISPDKSTLLHWAAIGGNCNTISFLLSVGLSPHAVTIAGCTPYVLAQLNDHTEAARLLNTRALQRD